MLGKIGAYQTAGADHRFHNPALSKFGSFMEGLQSDVSPGSTARCGRSGGYSMVRRLFSDRRGATAIEYGLIAALIAVAAIAAMQGLGNSLNTTFSNVTSNMKAS